MSAGLIPYDEIKAFFDEGWIAELLFPVRSGKEAAVYCCTAGPRAGPTGDDFYALKVYHPSEQRSFKNAATYQEGRVVGDARETRAVTPSTPTASTPPTAPAWRRPRPR